MLLFLRVPGNQCCLINCIIACFEKSTSYLVACRYNFNKVAQYKQLTLEEAEEKMKNRRKTADGYQRWMMKVAHNGAAAFGEVDKDDPEGGGGGGKGRKKATGDDDEANHSDRGDEDEEEETSRKNRLGLNKKSVDDDEEGLRGGDLDFDDDDIEKGERYLFFSHEVNCIVHMHLMV